MLDDTRLPSLLAEEPHTLSTWRRAQRWKGSDARPAPWRRESERS